MPPLIDAHARIRPVDVNRSGPTGESPSADAPRPQHTSTPQLPYHPQAVRLAGGIVAGGGFDAQVRGRDARPVDMELARLAQDVYHADSDGSGRWSRLSDAQLREANIDPSMLVDDSTGFRSAIYQDGAGHYVLAFAGTDPTSGKDWLANGLQAGGLPSAQYSQAVQLASRAKAAFGNDLVLTGHSLGGGLASTASVATDSAAVTFNAAGINDATLRRAVPGGDPAAAKVEAANGLIRSYAVDGEVLTGEQEHGAARGFAPDAIGHRIALSDPHPPAWPTQFPGLNLVTDTAHGVQLHGMDSVLDAMQKDQPWNPAADRPGTGLAERIADGTMTAADRLVGGVDYVKNHAKSGIGRVADGTADSIRNHVGGVPGRVLGNVVDGGGRLLQGTVEVAGDAANGAIGIQAHLLQGAERFTGGLIKTIGHGISRAMPWNW